MFTNENQVVSKILNNKNLFIKDTENTCDRSFKSLSVYSLPMVKAINLCSCCHGNLNPALTKSGRIQVLVNLSNFLFGKSNRYGLVRLKSVLTSHLSYSNLGSSLPSFTLFINSIWIRIGNMFPEELFTIVAVPFADSVSITSYFPRLYFV